LFYVVFSLFFCKDTKLFSFDDDLFFSNFSIAVVNMQIVDALGQIGNIKFDSADFNLSLP